MAKVPAAAMVIAGVGEDNGVRVRNPVAFANLSAAVERLAVATLKAVAVEVGQRVVSDCSESPLKSTDERVSHLGIFKE